MAKSLIIVESPAKARTIKKILGRGYQVLPSMGHVKDLPKSRLGVDIEKGFAPTYVVIKERKKGLTQILAPPRRGPAGSLPRDHEKRRHPGDGGSPFPRQEQVRLPAGQAHRGPDRGIFPEPPPLEEGPARSLGGKGPVRRREDHLGKGEADRLLRPRGILVTYRALCGKRPTRVHREARGGGGEEGEAPDRGGDSRPPQGGGERPFRGPGDPEEDAAALSPPAVHDLHTPAGGGEETAHALLPDDDGRPIPLRGGRGPP